MNWPSLNSKKPAASRAFSFRQTTLSVSAATNKRNHFHLEKK